MCSVANLMRRLSKETHMHSLRRARRDRTLFFTKSQANRKIQRRWRRSRWNGERRRLASRFIWIISACFAHNIEQRIALSLAQLLISRTAHSVKWIFRPKHLGLWAKTPRIVYANQGINMQFFPLANAFNRKWLLKHTTNLNKFLDLCKPSRRIIIEPNFSRNLSFELQIISKGCLICQYVIKIITI